MAPPHAGFFVAMQFHPLLRNADERVFLIHVTITNGLVNAGLLVVDGYVDDGWLRLSAGEGLEEVVYNVQLPQEVLQQSQRYKVYDVVLPFRRPT